MDEDGSPGVLKLERLGDQLAGIAARSRHTRLSLRSTSLLSTTTWVRGACSHLAPKSGTVGAGNANARSRVTL
jgi:hypothetical protein